MKTTNTNSNVARSKGKGKSKNETVKSRIQEVLNAIGGGFNDFIFSIRTGMLFDAQKQTKLKPQHYNNIVNYYNNNKLVIFVERNENTVIHERVFEAVMELGELKNNNGKDTLIINNLYQLKKLAGINVKKRDSDILKIIDDISKIHVRIDKVSDDGKRVFFLTFRFLGSVIGIIEKPDEKAKGLEIALDARFVDAIKHLSKIKMDRETMYYINTHVKSAYTERIIKHFIIQQKPQTFKGNGFWGLLMTICDIPMLNKNDEVEYKIEKLSRKQKWIITNEIAVESQLLAQFGIKFDKKNLKLEYNPAENMHKYAVLIGYSEV